MKYQCSWFALIFNVFLLVPTPFFFSFCSCLYHSNGTSVWNLDLEDIDPQFLDKRNHIRWCIIVLIKMAVWSCCEEIMISERGILGCEIKLCVAKVHVLDYTKIVLLNWSVLYHAASHNLTVKGQHPPNQTILVNQSSSYFITMFLASWLWECFNSFSCTSKETNSGYKICPVYYVREFLLNMVLFYHKRLIKEIKIRSCCEIEFKFPSSWFQPSGSCPLPKWLFSPF